MYSFVKIRVVSFSRIACILFTLVALFALAISAIAQEEKPTPPAEVPEVVSRDRDSAKRVPSSTETVERQKPAVNVLTPTKSEFTLPPTPSSTYNISLTEAQQKMMLFLDLLAKTEARAESLRSRLFETIDRENSTKSKIQQVRYRLQPEQLRNAAALSGSLRPETVREQRGRLLREEESNLRTLLSQIQTSRRNLEIALESADRLVDKVRRRFEFYVDKALEEEPGL